MPTYQIIDLKYYSADCEFNQQLFSYIKNKWNIHFWYYNIEPDFKQCAISLDSFDIIYFAHPRELSDRRLQVLINNIELFAREFMLENSNIIF